MSAVICAVRANRMYMSATTNAHSIGLSSLVVEMAKLMVTTKSKMIEERCHKGLYSVDLEGTLRESH
jgi:predicted ATPase